MAHRRDRRRRRSRRRGRRRQRRASGRTPAAEPPAARTEQVEHREGLEEEVARREEAIRVGRPMVPAAAEVVDGARPEATPAVAAAAGGGARVCICERDGQGAIVLSGAAPGSLAGGAQAARKHSAAAAAATRGAQSQRESAARRQRRGAAHVRKLSSMLDLPLDRELRTDRSMCISKAHHLEDRVDGTRAGDFFSEARVERTGVSPLLQMCERAWRAIHDADPHLW